MSIKCSDYGVCSYDCYPISSTLEYYKELSACSNMHFTLILLALFISLAVGDVNPSKFTYWLDPESCTGKRDMSDIVKETKQMGERAAARLDSVTDTDYQRVYEFLMKRPKSDQENLRKIRSMAAHFTGKYFLSIC